jgi:hypothetical protein
MIEVMKAFEDGKKIEFRERGSRTWKPDENPEWDWSCIEYRIAPEPKKGGRWERVEVTLCGDIYMFKPIKPGHALCSISNISRHQGFGGIEYRSPFDEKVIVRSMVPLMFEETGGWATFDFAEHYRPGIPVAAWFWRES